MADACLAEVRARDLPVSRDIAGRVIRLMSLPELERRAPGHGLGSIAKRLRCRVRGV